MSPACNLGGNTNLTALLPYYLALKIGKFCRYPIGYRLYIWFYALYFMFIVGSSIKACGSYTSRDSETKVII
jgi:hypothetical protein